MIKFPPPPPNITRFKSTAQNLEWKQLTQKPVLSIKTVNFNNCLVIELRQVDRNIAVSLTRQDIIESLISYNLRRHFQHTQPASTEIYKPQYNLKRKASKERTKFIRAMKYIISCGVC